MQVHSVQDQTILGQIEKLKQASVKRVLATPFQDPIREFARASQTEGMVRGWLTYPVEDRKRRVKEEFRFIPRYPGDESQGVRPESDQAFEARQLERWRGLCVIIQEESRSKQRGGSPEVALGALKQLFYDHDWKAKAPVAEPSK